MSTIRDQSYSTTRISGKLLSDIQAALQNLDYGSIELYVCDHIVTHITRRHIMKTKPCSENKRVR